MNNNDVTYWDTLFCGFTSGSFGSTLNSSLTAVSVSVVVNVVLFRIENS